MSITATYRRITQQEFSQLQENSEAAQPFVGSGQDSIDLSKLEALFDSFQEYEANERYFSLEKEWHALHFLLTGESGLNSNTQASPPYCNVVMGGTPTPLESDYGPVRYLNPEEVRAVAALLSTISAEDLLQRFDPVAFNAVDIYPLSNHRSWNEEELEPLLEMYPGLVEFFEQAAKDKDIVLLSFE